MTLLFNVNQFKFLKQAVDKSTYLCVLGSICAYSGHVRNPESLGVCRGLQKEAFIIECVGRY